MSLQATSHNVPEYSVSELSFALKRVVEGHFEHVRVRGEISGFKAAASGHLYMNLKDAESVIRAVCWRGMAARLGVRPEDGLEVVVSGKLSTFPGRSEYQIIIESMELAGEGAILKMLEERKKRLAAEGLFDEARKKPLPFLPNIIGVITSPTGAVIHDIYTTLERRFPRRVIMAPVKVQGEGAAEEITAAIHGFNAMKDNRPDVLIVARGGGSLEDLLPFSEENVVRAVAACEIPVISSVGHEVDTMLIDYAADRRAPTPTAAAEMSVPVRAELLQYLQKEGLRLSQGALRFLKMAGQQLSGLARGIINPESFVLNMAQRLDQGSERLGHAIATFLKQAALALPVLRPPHDLYRQASLQVQQQAGSLLKSMERRMERLESRFERAAGLLESYSYKNTLERGFALVRDGAGRALTSAASIQPGQALRVTFKDGDIEAESKGESKTQGKLL